MGCIEMNDLQKADLKGYKEIDRLEFSKELVYTLYGIGILALFAFGFLFLSIYSQFTGKFSGTIDVFDIIPGTLLFAGTLILHELIHGIFVSMYGGKPRYGAGIYSILPYLYTTTKSIFPRNQFIIIYIAPLAVISIIGVAAMAAFPSIAHWILLPLIVNASGSVGDLWMTRTLLRYPGHILVEDKKTGTIIYGKEMDKPVKVSAAGFGSKFLKGVTISFLAIAIILTLLPVALNIMGTGSFTIGLQNSPYTIFEYNSPKDEEGFFLGFNILPALFISVIFGLVYAILTTVYTKGS